MKRFFSSIRFGLIPISGVLVVAVLLSACTKFDDDDNGTETPVSGLMAFNLVPDKAAIGIALNGNNLSNAPLSYTNFTGTYLRVYSGNREIESFDINTDSALAKSNYGFELNKYYSLFVTGANGVYTNIVTHDNFDSLNSSSGKAYIRYINAIPDSTKPTVSITANGINVFNTQATYTSVSDFAAADPGQISVGVKNNATIDASRSFSIEQGKAYTVLLIGVPGATDTTKAVQIKYIENGSLTEGQ